MQSTITHPTTTHQASTHTLDALSRACQKSSSPRHSDEEVSLQERTRTILQEQGTSKQWTDMSSKSAFLEKENTLTLVPPHNLALSRLRSVFMKRSAVEIQASKLASTKPLELLPEVRKEALLLVLPCLWSFLTILPATRLDLGDQK